jgi:FMN reductase
MPFIGSRTPKPSQVKLSAMSRDLVLLIGNPRPGSRTRAVAEHIASILQDTPADVIELADVTGISYTNEPAAALRPDENALDRVRDARVLIVATPSYKGTYTGLLKLFLDRLTHGALDGVVALPVAVAASHAHAETTAEDVSRLLRELGARVPGQVALLEAQLSDPDIAGALDSGIVAASLEALAPTDQVDLGGSSCVPRGASLVTRFDTAST